MVKLLQIIVSEDLNELDLSTKILKEFNIDDEIRFIFENERYRNNMDFNQYANYLADMHVNVAKLVLSSALFVANASLKQIKKLLF